MPKVHNIGSKRFIQFLNFPAQWGWKVVVKGWTQEIEDPYRTAEPYIVRLPFRKAVVFGRWIGTLTEDEALNKAVQRRDLTYDDFQEENGWIPAPDQVGEESGEYSYSRIGDLG
jgi:hypothetical protein